MEILFNDDVPDKVAIDEALALAKTLCDDDSPAFIHGLLSAVCTAKNAAPAPESVAEEADEESSDSAAAASEPTDEGDVSDSPDSSGASDEPAAPSAEIQRRSISHLLFSLPIREAFSWADTCAAVHSQVGTLPTAPPAGVRLCVQRRVSLRWPLTLVRIPEKHKGVLVSQNESGTIAIPMYDKDDAVLVLEDGQVYVGSRTRPR